MKTALLSLLALLALPVLAGLSLRWEPGGREDHIAHYRVMLLNVKNGVPSDAEKVWQTTNTFVIFDKLATGVVFTASITVVGTNGLTSEAVYCGNFMSLQRESDGGGAGTPQPEPDPHPIGYVLLPIHPGTLLTNWPIISPEALKGLK